MVNKSFQQLLELFTLTRLKFYLQLQDDAYLPAFTGSTLHGMLGNALLKYAPHASKVCFHQYENQQPKPYAIVANEQHKTKWHKGEIFSFEIKLFGDVCKIANQIVDAIDHFGKSDGIGGSGKFNRTKYQLISVASICQSQQLNGIHSYKMREHVFIEFNQTKDIALQLNSPLRIKQERKYLHQAPDLVLLLQNISRRWQLLTKYWQMDNANFLKSLHQNLPQNIRTENISASFYEDWQRHSIRQQEKLPFGGVLGQLRYNILDESKQYIIPWLAVGQLLQIGGKTTFGLGDYTLIC